MANAKHVLFPRISGITVASVTVTSLGLHLPLPTNCSDFNVTIFRLILVCMYDVTAIVTHLTKRDH